jgi:hypothetical protein
MRRMYVPERGRAQLIEGSAAEQARRLAAIIREFKERPYERHSGHREQRRGELRPITLELIGAAQRLRRDGVEVAVAIFAPSPRNLPLR